MLLTWREVEEAVSGCPNPFTKILGICQAGAEPHNPDGLVFVDVADLAHAGHNDLDIIGFCAASYVLSEGLCGHI